MAEIDIAQQALDLRQLQLPLVPQVIELRVEDYEDADGEAALRVLLILEESTDLESLQGKDISDLKMAIWDSLKHHGVKLVPYIEIALPSELEDAINEEV